MLKGVTSASLIVVIVVAAAVGAGVGGILGNYVPAVAVALMVNVESIGGHLLVQHYLAEKASPNHVLMHSTNTRVYVLHVLTAPFRAMSALGH